MSTNRQRNKQSTQALLFFFGLALGSLTFSCRPHSNSDETDVQIQSQNTSTQLHFQSSKVDGCMGGKMHVLTLPAASIGKKYALAVYRAESLKVRSVKTKLQAEGVKPVAIVNGGYFDEKNGTLYSYYKASTLKLEGHPKEHSSNSALSPRGCLAYNKTVAQVQFDLSAQTTFEKFKTSNLDVMCAGPQVIRLGANVARAQACSEHFLPAPCRKDSSDPLEFDSSRSRTASCKTASGDYKIFSVSSGVLPCGMSIEALAEKMKAAGCHDALMHDGGSSTAFWAKTEGGEFEFAPPFYANRKVPVWLVVTEK